MTNRVTTDRRVESWPERQHFLVATRSFTYVDPYLGEDRVIEGKTHVVPDHWLVTEYPDAWAVSDRPCGILDSAPVPIDPHLGHG